MIHWGKKVRLNFNWGKSMNKLLILGLILILISTIKIQAQLNTDTLFIGHQKVLLRKSRIFHINSQNGPVNLPSEYKKTQDYSSNLSIKYKAKTDSSNSITFYDDGTKLSVIKPNMNQSTGGHINLYSLVDTIKITLIEFCNFKPYIKSNLRKTYFFASKVSYLYHDTLGIIEYINIPNGDLSMFWNPCGSYSKNISDKLKQTTFILQELYYVKSNATYYLDREFIILIN